jgi:mono/diheme cytochrome c family protein
LLASAAGCLVVGSADFRVPAAHAASKPTHEENVALFHDKGCEHCHGVDGVGGTDLAPALSSVGRTLHKPDIERQIREGGKQMPAFGDSLTNDEVQQLVAYLAAKKKKVAKHPRASGVTDSKS